jgi:hypothetical protein
MHYPLAYRLDQARDDMVSYSVEICRKSLSARPSLIALDFQELRSELVGRLLPRWIPGTC